MQQNINRPLVLSGNGSSLTKIDYRRVPKSFDSYRVNQFFLEDKYYLGKEITGIGASTTLFEHLLYTIWMLRENQEYNIDALYSARDRDDQQLNNHYSTIDQYLTKDPLFSDFMKKLELHEYFNDIMPTTGLRMLLLAVAKGYKDIFIVGIDFYKGNTNSRNYAYEIKSNSNYDNLLNTINESLRNNPMPVEIEEQRSTLRYEEKYPNTYTHYHSFDLDKEVIEFCASLPGINLYSISEESTINELIPLAPILEEHFEGATEKPQNAIKDILISRKYLTENPPEEDSPQENPLPEGRVQKIKQKFIDKGMESDWNSLRENIYLRLIYHLIKPFVVALKFMLKKP